MDPKLRALCVRQFDENKRTHLGKRYTVPSADTYPYQWFWDSCFHAITLSYFDVERAKEELELLISAQFRNGMIPHMIYWHQPEKSSFPEIRWGKRRTSSITQPPMLAAAVWRIYEETGDEEFVLRFLPHLHAFHRYLFRTRDPYGYNLVAIINPDESGEDNSPRFDAVLGLKDPRHQFVDNFRARLDMVDDWRESRYVVKESLDDKYWIYDVSYNCILAESLRLTGLLADVVEVDRISSYSLNMHTKVITAINTYLNKHGHYRSVYGKKLKRLNNDTWVSFMPLYAGAATHHEAAALVTHYLSNRREYATPYSLPTVPLSQASFDPSGDWKGDWWVGTNWRGPVWMSANWFILQGLLRYGFHGEAQKLYRDSLRLLRQSGMREYYDPLTGRGHGALGFTWGGLVLDMHELIKATENKKPR